jgi:drug/metabolite transporter (DMT)-like permease
VRKSTKTDVTLLYSTGFDDCATLSSGDSIQPRDHEPKMKTVWTYISLCIIWGSTWSVIKLGLTEAPPMYSLAFRVLLAVIVLLLLLKIKNVRIPGDKKYLLRLALPGLFMYGLSYGCVYLAELYISSALMAILFSSFPVMVALISYFRLPDEKLRPLGWGGLVIGMTGVVIISSASLSESRDIFIGTLLGLLGVLTAAIGMIEHKKKFSHENITLAVTVQMTFGGLPLFLVAFLFEDISSFNFNLVSIGSVAYLALFGSVLAFLGYYYLIRRINVVPLSMIAFVTPLVAIVFGVMLFSETLSLATLTGGALVLASILLVIRKPKATDH